MKKSNLIILETGTKTLVLEKLDPKIDIYKAIREATYEYLLTNEGFQIWQKKKHQFSYANFKRYVPNEICEKHGFRKLESTKTDKASNLAANFPPFEPPKPGTEIIVSGNVEYAHITSHIDGEELEKTTERQLRLGMTPIYKPHITITISSPTTLNTCLAENPSVEEFIKNYNIERYMDRKYYYSPRTDTKKFSMVDKKPTLPKIYTMRNGQMEQVHNPKELELNTNVTLILKVYEATRMRHIGIQLDSVIINKPAPNTDPIAAFQALNNAHKK